MSETDKTRLPQRFKRKVLMLIGALSAIATGAFAAILISASIGGTLTTVAKPTMAWTGTPTTVATDGSGISCTPTVSGGKLNLSVANAMPGSTCTIDAKTAGTGRSDLVVQGLEVSDLDIKLQKVSGMSSLRACGDTLHASNPADYRMKISVPESAAVVSGKPLTGQLVAVPQAQFDPALCSN